jgi:hypothetical protein
MSPLLRTARRAALLGALVAPAALQAQQTQNASRTNPLAAGSRIGVAINGIYAAPQEEFRTFVDNGGGLGGSFLVKLDPSGVLALRVDASWITYGSERTRVPLSPTTGNLITVDLNTSHNIFMGGVGLQLQAPSGPIRPYVGGTAGIGTFWTQSTIEGTDNDDQPFAQSTNQRDNTFAWSGVGGLTIPLTGAGTVLMDLGVTYQANGEATYLPPGVIRDANDQVITRDPVRSRTDMLLYRVGVRFGF